MSFDENEHSERVLVALDDGTPVYVEVAFLGDENVGFDAKSFKPIADSIESLVKAVSVPIRKVSPSKASIKFGMEIGIEQGSLVAVIVRGTGKANLEITLEWTKEKSE